MTHSTEGVAEDPHAFWITTASRGKFYPKDPEGTSYVIPDIAHALSNTCRFSGQCDRFYSVAEHSILVSKLAYEIRPKVEGPNDPLNTLRWGLLHDASEAYLTDIPRPIKYLPEMAGYRALEKRVMAAIQQQFGLSETPPPIVKEADLLMLRSEAKHLGLLSQEWDVYDWPDCGTKPKPMAPGEAELEFIKACNEVWD